MAKDNYEEFEDLETSEEIEARIEKHLGALEKSVDEGKRFASVVGDPDVQAILKARQEGRSVKVVFPDDIPKKKDEVEDEDEEVYDLDSLTNTELTQHLVKTFGKTLDKVMSQKLVEINDTVRGLKGHVESSQQAAIEKKIADARDKYSDFDDFAEDIVRLAKDAPGLDPIELYETVVRRSGGTPTLKVVETERPSSVSARPTRKRTRKEPLPGGLRGFKQMVNESLNSERMNEILKDLPDR